jgi:membrane protease YdiL (CAAX protease family)
LNDTESVGEAIRQGLENPLAFSYLLVARAISEEIFFRGFLSKKVGIIFSSSLFGLAHFLYGSVVEVAGAMVLGLLLARSFSKTKNLYVNMIAHFLYNLLAIVMIV